MADLVVIVPSRGRPQAIREFIDAFGNTRTVAELVVAVDDDDPLREEYSAITGGPVFDHDTGGKPSTMVRALNAVAIHRAFLTDPPFAIGFMGDDHRPRTVGWDKAYLDALREMGTGIVYGDDLLQGENIPTQCAMTSDIVRALGYMCPPTFTHLYVDNFWKVLGNGADCLRYLPDVIIEHLHPHAGKADWDPNYLRVNSSAMYERDAGAFSEWLSRSMIEDVAKVRSLRTVAA